MPTTTEPFTNNPTIASPLTNFDTTNTVLGILGLFIIVILYLFTTRNTNI